jgi:hypothetical protein
MPNPDGLPTVTIHGKFEEPNATGTALSGSVTFTPNVDIVTFPDQNVIVGGTETATLDSNGEFTITLIATDTANQQPSGWTYSVTEKLIGPRQRTYNIFLPYTVATVELADITPTSAAPTYLPVTGPQGPPGDVSSVNGHTGPSVTLTYTDVHALSDSAVISSSLIPDLSSTYITVARIGAANGVAGLNSSLLVPSTQLDLASSAPPSVGTGAVGTSTKLARQDHTHDGVDLVNTQTIAGAKTWSNDARFNARFAIGVAPGSARAAVQSTVDEVVMLLQQTAASPTNSIARLIAAASTDPAVGFRASGDTVHRFSANIAGLLNWGPGGSTAVDVGFYRSSAGNLNTTGQLNSDQAAPTAISHLTRKDYVDAADALAVKLAGAQTITGNKTFSGTTVFSGNRTQATGIGAVLIGYKNNTTTIQSNTTQTADPELTVNVEANATYLITTYIAYATDPNADIVFGWDFPSGALLSWTPAALSGQGTGDTGTIRMVSGATSFTITTATSAQQAAIATGTIIIGSTAGVVDFKWAQATSTAANTSLVKGCWIRLERVA